MTVICNACAQEWDRHPALAADCPQCGAPAGKDCIRPSGHSGPFIEPHVAREQAAVDAGLLELCPEGPTARLEQPPGSGIPQTQLQPTLL